MPEAPSNLFAADIEAARRPRRKRAIAGAVAAGLAVTSLVGGGYLLLDRRDPQTGPLQTADVSRADVDQTVDLTGAVERLSGVFVTPSAPGVVADVRVKVGDRVKAGQVLASMDSKAARAALTKAQADVVRARAGAVAPPAPATGDAGDLKSAQKAANSARGAVQAAAGARERARVACSALADDARIDQTPPRSTRVPSAPAVPPAPTAPARPTPRQTPTASSPAPERARTEVPEQAPAPTSSRESQPASAPRSEPAAEPATGPATGPATEATDPTSAAPALRTQPMSLVRPLAADTASMPGASSTMGRVKAEPSERQVQACVDALAAAMASDRNASGMLDDLSTELGRASAQMQRMSATADRAARAAQAGSNASLAAMVKAEAQLAMAQQAVDGGTLVAGIDGEVTSVGLEEDKPALPGQGIGVAGKGAAELIVNVPLARVGLLRVGQAATVQPPGQGKALAARITAIGSTPNDKGTIAPLYPVHVTVGDAPTSLGTGTIATATIKVASVDDVKTVPVSALSGFAGGKGTVRVVTDGTPTERTVEVGAVGQGRVEIRSGLKYGETVVIADPGAQLPNDLMNDLPLPRPGQSQ